MGSMMAAEGEDPIHHTHDPIKPFIHKPDVRPSSRPTEKPVNKKPDVEKKEPKKPAKNVCCMRVKSGVSEVNIAGIFLIYVALACAIGFYNAKVVTILTADDYLGPATALDVAACEASLATAVTATPAATSAISLAVTNTTTTVAPATATTPAATGVATTATSADWTSLCAIAEVGTLLQNIMIYQLVFSGAFAILIGYFYDMGSRRLTLGLGLLGTCIFVAVTPHISKSLAALTWNRMILGLFIHMAVANPLVPDTVNKDSTGRGYSIVFLGGTVGLMLAYWLLNLYPYDPKDLANSTDLHTAFLIDSVIVLAIAVVAFALIREPTSASLNLERPQKTKRQVKVHTNESKGDLKGKGDDFKSASKPKGFFQQLGYLAKRMVELYTSDLNFFYGLVAGSVVLMMAISGLIYNLLWVYSMIANPASPAVNSFETARSFYTDAMLWSVGFCLILIPVIGFAADKVQPWILQPAIFIAHGIISAVVYYGYKGTPDQIASTFLGFVTFLLFCAAGISVLAFYTKWVPGDVRGTMLGALAFGASMNGALFVYICKDMLVDTMNPLAPYGAICYCDFFVVLFAVIAAFAGKKTLRLPRDEDKIVKKTDKPAKDEESGSKKNTTKPVNSEYAKKVGDQLKKDLELEKAFSTAK